MSFAAILGRIDETPFWLRGLLAGLLCLAVQLPFLTVVPQITVDEPWYANTAYNLAQGQGLVNTNTGWRGGDEFFLYTVALAGVFQLTDATLWAARFFSVILGTLATLGFVRLGTRLELRGSTMALGVLLLVSGNVFYMVFRRVRPEVVVVLCAIAALYFLFGGLQQRHRRLFFAAGLFSGAACLAHPNAALLVVLLTVVVLRNVFRQRDARPLPYFLAGVGLCMAALLVHITQIREVPVTVFFEELFFSSERVALPDSSFLAGVVDNAVLFFNDYTLGIKRAYILIFEVGIMVVGLLCGRRQRALRLVSGVGLGYLVLALLFLRPFHRIGFVVVIVFSLMSFLLLVDRLEVRSALRRCLLVAGILYLGNNVAGDAYVLHRGRAWNDYSELSRRIERDLPDDATVICNMSFWFPLRDKTTYTHSTRWRFTPYENLAELLASGDATHAVISNYILDGISPTTGEPTVYPIRHRRFYETLEPYLVQNAKLVTSIATTNYGEVQVWRIPAAVRKR
ncbi:MAG: glycosyltransferase family 39 protein [Planctomycetota bacterium]